MIKLLAFDWNGTLLEDTKVVVDATNMAFRHFGYKTISLARYRETFTIPVVDFWLANGGKKADMSVEHGIFYANYYKKIAGKAKFRPGAKTLLNRLKKLGIQSIIYSNHTVNEIARQLKRFKIGKYFQAVLARPNFKEQGLLHKKNKQEKLAHFLKGLKIKPSEILNVGDTCEEIDIGHNLHIKTCAITGGENNTRRLKTAKPDFLIHNMGELTGIIKKLNRP